MATLEEIEAAGGALRVIDQGIGRRMMTEGAVRRQQAIDSGDRPWVTVNMWPQAPDVSNTAFRVDPAATDRQLERLARVRATRNEKRVRAALEDIALACAGGANTMPAVLEAVRAYATVGEICDCWRGQFGTFTPSTDF